MIDEYNKYTNGKTDIDAHISDLVSKFLYYDRKEDEDLVLGEIENMVADGVITIDDMVESFRMYLKDSIR